MQDKNDRYATLAPATLFRALARCEISLVSIKVGSGLLTVISRFKGTQLLEFYLQEVFTRMGR